MKLKKMARIQRKSKILKGRENSLKARSLSKTQTTIKVPWKMILEMMLNHRKRSQEEKDLLALNLNPQENAKDLLVMLFKDLKQKKMKKRNRRNI